MDKVKRPRSWLVDDVGLREQFSDKPEEPTKFIMGIQKNPRTREELAVLRDTISLVLDETAPAEAAAPVESETVEA